MAKGQIIAWHSTWDTPQRPKPFSLFSARVTQEKAALSSNFWCSLVSNMNCFSRKLSCIPEQTDIPKIFKRTSQQPLIQAASHKEFRKEPDTSTEEPRAALQTKDTHWELICTRKKKIKKINISRVSYAILQSQWVLQEPADRHQQFLCQQDRSLARAWEVELLHLLHTHQ